MSREVNRGRGPGGRGAGEPDEVLATVDRELRAALSITPSPEFEARVRQRIDERVAAPRWRWMASSMWIAAAAALVLVTAAGIVMMKPVADRGLTVARREGHDTRLPGPPRISPAAQPQPSEPTAPTPRVAVRHHAPVRREPEVIVPLNQLEAVRRLALAIDEGRVDASAPAAGPLESPAEPVPPAEVVVRPIVVEPLPIPTFEPDAVTPSSAPRRLQ